MKIILTSIFLFTIIFTHAQRTYTKEWKRIDSLIEKTGLIKTALKETNNIYTLAKKENNEVQVIKALVYRMSLNDQLSDSGRYENIALLEKELDLRAVIERQPMQPGDVPQTFADISRARELLGYNPQTPIEDGLRLFVEWFRNK
jgi:dTDP-D-glucose 4,6-dehydratase